MKSSHLPALLLSGFVLLGISLVAQEILPTELPAAARRAIDQESGGDPIRKVTRHVEDGRPFYLVEMERESATNALYRVTETGELLPVPTAPTEPRTTDPLIPALDPTLPAPIMYDRSKLSLNELPAAVQDSIRHHANGRPTGNIDREVWEGRTVYEVEFRQEESNSVIHVAEDGTILQDNRPSFSAKVKDFFIGTRLTDTPAPVQETVRREAAGRRINDIDIERSDDETTYEVEIEDGESSVFQLHVDPTGRVIKDSRTDTPQP